jgi:hypothetical protein
MNTDAWARLSDSAATIPLYLYIYQQLDGGMLISPPQSPPQINLLAAHLTHKSAICPINLNNPFNRWFLCL